MCFPSSKMTTMSVAKMTTLYTGFLWDNAEIIGFVQSCEGRRKHKGAVLDKHIWLGKRRKNGITANEGRCVCVDLARGQRGVMKTTLM